MKGIRKSWGPLNPIERTHEKAGRRGHYSREDEKRALQAQLDEELEPAEERWLDNVAGMCDSVGHERRHSNQTTGTSISTPEVSAGGISPGIDPAERQALQA